MHGKAGLLSIPRVENRNMQDRNFNLAVVHASAGPKIRDGPVQNRVGLGKWSRVACCLGRLQMLELELKGAVWLSDKELPCQFSTSSVLFQVPFLQVVSCKSITVHHKNRRVSSKNFLSCSCNAFELFHLLHWGLDQPRKGSYPRGDVNCKAQRWAHPRCNPRTFCVISW